MNRSTRIALLVFMTAAHGAGQAPVPPPLQIAEEQVSYSGPGPLTDRRLIKDKFRASHSDPQVLAQARVDVARVLYEARLREFLAARGSIDLVGDAVYVWLDAELGVAPDDAQRLLICQRRWEQAWEVERIYRIHYEAGRIPIQDFAQSTYTRTDAEIQWAEERARQKKAGAKGSRAPVLPPPLDDVADLVPRWKLGPLEDQEHAKDKFEALQADPKALAQAKAEAAEDECAARFREFGAGRGILDSLHESMNRRLEAELVVAETDAIRLLFFEWRWEMARFAEIVNTRRFENGGIPIQDLARSTLNRLEAEIQWARERASKKEERDRPKGDSDSVASLNTVPDHLFHLVRAGQRPLPENPHRLTDDFRQFAKEKFDALRTDLQALKQARLRVARLELDTRMREFTAGRGRLDFLLHAASRVLKSQLAVCTNRPERIAALEDHWSVVRTIERINRARYEASRIPTQDYRMSTYYRIDAEQQLRAANGIK